MLDGATIFVKSLRVQAFNIKWRMRTRKFSKALEVAEKLLFPLFLLALRPISDQDNGARIKRMGFAGILADALAKETTLIFKLIHKSCSLIVKYEL
jgi:hypothetical protein